MVCGQPGYVEGEDVTSTLIDHGYFGSYNMPYIPFIDEVSGTEALEEEYGPWFRWVCLRLSVSSCSGPPTHSKAACDRASVAAC